MEDKTTKPTISVVFGSYNRLSFLKLTLESLRNELINIPHEIIVVDGGSTDGSVKFLCTQKDVVTIIQHNRGEWRGKPVTRRSWGYFMNLGFKAAQGKYICMVSDDCLIVPGAIMNGYNLFEGCLKQGEKVGAMAFYFRDWPVQEKYFVGLTLGNNMFVNHGLYLRRALEEVGFIDEDNYMFYCADGDLCLKMWQKGYKCIDSPNSFIEHHSHANFKVRRTNSSFLNQDLENYKKKWKNIYFFKDNPVMGGSIEKDFVDSCHTADQFKKFKGNVLLTKLLVYLENSPRFLKFIKKARALAGRQKS